MVTIQIIKINKIIKFSGPMNSPLRILGRGNGLTGLWVSSFTFIAPCQATRTHKLLWSHIEYPKVDNRNQICKQKMMVYWVYGKCCIIKSELEVYFEAAFSAT